MEKIDSSFLKATELLSKRLPFVICKPQTISFETMVPYLAYRLNYDLVKVELVELGSQISDITAFYMVREVLGRKTDKETLVWVRDLSVVKDKTKFVLDVLNLFKRSNFHVVFTAVEGQLLGLDQNIPRLDWKTRYENMENFPYTQIQANSCSSLLRAPQDLHFRVFSNIIHTLIRKVKVLPEVILEAENGKKASLQSIILTSLLGIKKNNLVAIYTNYEYKKHREIVDSMMEGWEKSLTNFL